MNACQSLPAAILLFLFATASAPLNGVSVQAQDRPTGAESIIAEETEPAKEPVENTIPAETTEDPASNPFVPATEPQAGTVTNDSFKAIEEALVGPVPEEETAEVEMPMSTPTVVSVPVAEPKVYFDAPAASQSDRRIAKEKVAQLRQQRALYRANQRMARMEYNLWMGHQPLRPDWNPMPMMSSRYAPPTIVVPIFVSPR